MMNKKIEDKFKESLQGFEMPYDASAWAALSSELDKRQSSSKSNTGRNWLIGGGTFLLATLVVCAIWLSNENPSSDEQHRTEQQKNLQAKYDADNTTPSKRIVNNNVNRHHHDVPNQQLIDAGEESYMLPEATQINNERTNVYQGSNGLNQGQETINDKIGYNNTVKKDQEIEKPSKESSASNHEVSTGIQQNVPFVVESMAATCVGNIQKCNNTNSCEMLVVKPSGEQLTIPKGGILEILVDQEGVYYVGRLINGSFKEETSFAGLPNAKAEMQFKDEEAYEGGLPVVKLSTSSETVNATWTIGKKRAPLFGKEVNAHFYYKGNEEVTLTIVHENGCTSSENRTIQITKDYHLLAVTAFDPLSSDNRKNAFMPFALTQRNVDFTMIVIDPTDGAVIFETDDATLPWKGTDKRNGQLVEPNKAFIWRVLLANPEEGEPEEYKGTIVRM